MSILGLQVCEYGRALHFFFIQLCCVLYKTSIYNKNRSISDPTLIGATVTYVAGLFLLLSFAGPYWIESYPEMLSSFKHMGLWEYCFDRFRFPSYQFDKLFHGCHYIFSEVSVSTKKFILILQLKLEKITYLVWKPP